MSKLDELTMIQEVPWFKVFFSADNIVLVDEIRIGVNAKLEIWRDTLEFKGFQLVGIKQSTWNVSVVKEDEWMVKFDGPKILKSESF